jgi:hypothetical protein
MITRLGSVEELRLLLRLKSGSFQVFHGTSSVAVESIKKNGLLPRGGPGGGDAWLAKQEDERPGFVAEMLSVVGVPPEVLAASDRNEHVYVTRHPQHAYRYSRIVIKIAGGEPVVFELIIPDSEQGAVVMDPVDQWNGLMLKRAIPPSWINRIILVEANS